MITSVHYSEIYSYPVYIYYLLLTHMVAYTLSYTALQRLTFTAVTLILSTLHACLIVIHVCSVSVFPTYKSSLYRHTAKNRK